MRAYSLSGKSIMDPYFRLDYYQQQRSDDWKVSVFGMKGDERDGD